ncbi:MAG: hypothetical protein AB1391_03930 [Candidatus Micrarchaeota archaeon]
MIKKPNGKLGIYENANIKRAVQYINDGKKTEENLVYSIEIELNNKPLIVTVRIGKSFIDATVVDKTNGEMLEYVAQQNDKIEAIKRHNLNFEQVKKLLESKTKV